MTHPESDYEAKAQRGPSRRMSSAGLMFSHAITWGLLLAVLLFVVPRFETIFLDFGVETPAITNAAIRAAHTVNAVLPVVVLFVVCLLLADWIILGQLAAANQHEPRRLWSTLLFVIPLLGLGLALVAMMVPMFGLLTKLSG